MAKNKLTKFAEMATYKNVFEYTFKELQKTPFPLKGKWGKEYFKNDNPIVLELGCGKGEYTVGLARYYPNKNFIGIDIKGARMWSGASDAIKNNLENVAFVRTHIEMIAHFFDTNEVSEIWITFPDPQMKKTRKRLTSTSFLEKYRRILIPNGIIHLKTDSKFQYSYTLNLLHLNGFEILAETPDLYASKFINETLNIKTFYEKQWLSRGIPVKYLSFRINNNELKEPEIEIEKDDYRSFGRNARDI